MRIEVRYKYVLEGDHFLNFKDDEGIIEVNSKDDQDINKATKEYATEKFGPVQSVKVMGQNEV